MRTISLKLPDDLLAELSVEARVRQVTKSSLVRESLERALHPIDSRGPASCFDLARGMAGSIKGLPEDLAGDPRYMEEFGK